MKLKKVTVLLAVSAFVLAGCNDTEKGVLENATITTEKPHNDCETGTTYEEEEQETRGSGNLALEDSETVKTPTGRILTNDLCVGTAKEIFEQTNAERIAAGLEPLIWDDELAKYADIRAEEIITNFSHTRDDGTKCYVLSDLIWGENIARGPHANGYEFLEHWMESPGHKANILEPRYTTLGVGFTCTEQGDTAVQLFGTDVVQ